MAGASLLTLLDDIASILDDVALMSKVAARKTAGVLGDDLALNAQQVTGVSAERELPVVWAVAKGSLKNKAILIPAAMLISAFIPWAIMPLLMCGGLFLCFEGFEKVFHWLTHKPDADEAKTVIPENIDLKVYEAEKVKGAIRTDFVLSAEIIAITLGIVETSDLWTQFFTLCVIAVIMTLGVYGIVAAIVKMDDAGLYLSQRQGEGFFTRAFRRFGLMLVNAAPPLMKLLTIVGTIAMFMVGGGILSHGIHWLTVQIERIASALHQVNDVGPILAYITPSLLHIVIGVIAGGITLVVISLVNKLRGKPSH
ncbi:DUF808 domain-containing protein [Shewanella marina]|uniref:DUF808 domain-containing protein n=1 Tax=Shewanella marina TaxID=487319 RepID=UPI000472E30D|nr:DUF808 domain-containing protein [Shewanella marina]